MTEGLVVGWLLVGSFSSWGVGVGVGKGWGKVSEGEVWSRLVWAVGRMYGSVGGAPPQSPAPILLPTHPYHPTHSGSGLDGVLVGMCGWGG